MPKPTVGGRRHEVTYGLCLRMAAPRLAMTPISIQGVGVCLEPPVGNGLPAW